MLAHVDAVAAHSDALALARLGSLRAAIGGNKRRLIRFNNYSGSADDSATMPTWSSEGASETAAHMTGHEWPASGCGGGASVAPAMSARMGAMMRRS